MPFANCVCGLAAISGHLRLAICVFEIQEAICDLRFALFKISKVPTPVSPQQLFDFFLNFLKGSRKEALFS